MYQGTAGEGVAVDADGNVYAAEGPNSIAQVGGAFTKYSSETFPLEIRALAIAFFYAVGTGIGGAGGPWLLGTLIDTGSRVSVAAGYLLGAVLMVVAAFVEWRWGVATERRPLEEISRPLSSVDE